MAYAHLCVICQSLTEAKAKAIARCRQDKLDVIRLVSVAVTISGLEAGLLPMEGKLLMEARLHRQLTAVYYRESLQDDQGR